MRKHWDHRLTRNSPRTFTPRPRVVHADPTPRKGGDTGRYVSGYRVFRDGSYREDFGADR